MTPDVTPAGAPAETPIAALVLLAAGSGIRTGLATNKVFATLAGRPLLSWSLAAIRAEPRIGPVLLVVRAEDEQRAAEVVRKHSHGRHVRLVLGGPTRHASEWNALCALGEELRSGAVDVVAIHDAARPLAPGALFADVIHVAREHGGAVPGRMQPPLLERADLRPYGGQAVGVQTPQAFRAQPLLAAYEAAARHGFTGSDTAACLERFSPGTRVRHVPGPATNLKVTFAEDVAVVEALLARPSGPGSALNAGVRHGGEDGQVVGVGDPPTG
jgi:2-C-methyl-D-erythritol 4-phosphate cytidylyltransferase